MIEVPEVDRGQWFSVDDAGEAILPAQRPFLASLCKLLGSDDCGPSRVTFDARKDAITQRRSPANT